MNYTTQSITFKLKKVFRYLKLYGISRTFIKVRGQYHMQKKYESLLDFNNKTKDKGNVGIIGCGNFSFSNIAYYVNKNYRNSLRGCMDVDINKAASLYDYYDLAYYSDSSEKIISDKNILLVYIASNHSSHAEYAIEALKNGKHVHIEKPHVVTEDQLIRLCRAMSESKSKVNLGFNRPYSRFGIKILNEINTQEGPQIINWFIAGHKIELDHWYFREEEGGRILGNLCHWTDFTFRMIPAENRYPIKIIPTRAEKSDCDIAVTYIFGDGSIAAITFSAKGHSFEGVRERLSAHRDNVILVLEDFKTLTIDNNESKTNLSNFYRDHGHEVTIKNSYNMIDNKYPGYSVNYIWETGELFLKTKEALDRNETVTIQSGFNSSKLA